MLGWITLIFGGLAFVALVFGSMSMDRNSGERAMDGAMLMLFGFGFSAVFAVLGIVWLVMHVQFK